MAVINGQRERLTLSSDAPVYMFDRHAGTYRLVYEQKRMPSPGAMNYAYESLGLGMFSPIGPSIRVRNKMSVFAGAQLSTLSDTGINGVPLTAGQIAMQPLFRVK